jgi:hypothetical protein
VRGWARSATFVAGVALLYPLQGAIDEKKPELPSSLLYTPDKRLMSVIACGHGPTLADLVWVQSVNYVMREFQSGQTHIEHLYALFDVMTDLDPDFVDAYVMGSIFLSAVADEPERALDILEKGQGPLDLQNGEFVERRGPDGEPLGRVGPKNRQRFKLLHETAAIHLVSFASYAATYEERYEEIQTAGRLYLFGAKRYPRDQYPDRPDWWEEMGKELLKRHVGETDKGMVVSPLAWYLASREIWKQRLYFATPDTPIAALYKKRLDEVESRIAFEHARAKLATWKSYGGQAAAFHDIPKDPLGAGFFVVNEDLVAPALDAAAVERGLARDADRFKRRYGRYSSTLEEVIAFGDPVGKRREVPPWVHVEYDPSTGRITAFAKPLR